jgi:hypothetical protein
MPKEKKRDTVRHTRVESGFMEDSLRSMRKQNDLEEELLGERSDEDSRPAPVLKTEFKEDNLN